MRRPGVRVAIAVLAVLLISAAGFLGCRGFFGRNTYTAYFTSATAIYAGDDVRVAGVKVGTIDSIEPMGTKAKMILKVDRRLPIPAEAKAVVVAQSLIAPRYVQLTPIYGTAGPRMADGAVIPLERTAVPVEWDEIKIQLTRLSEALGPEEAGQTGPLGRIISSSADAFDGNGVKFSKALAELSSVAKVFADGSGDIVSVIKNLQIFVTALQDSNDQIVQFQERFATLTSVLDDNKSTLDAALTHLSVAISDVQRFVTANRGQATEQLQRLANLTQTLADSRMDLEQVLHVAPTALANFHHIYNPDQGTVAGSFVVSNFSNPVTFLCASIASLENVNAAEGAKLCSQYLGPVLKYVAFNYLPFPVNPMLGPTVKPDNITYSEPKLAPGGSEDPIQEPALSAPAASGPPTVDNLLLPGQGTQ